MRCLEPQKYLWALQVKLVETGYDVSSFLASDMMLVDNDQYAVS